MNERDRNPRREGATRRDGGPRRDGTPRRDGGRGRDGGFRRDPGPRSDRAAGGGRSSRGTGSAGRPDEPALPIDVAASDLDTEVRRDLLTLDKANAENVARHLVMVTRLLEEDPALALEHARAARRRAGRVGLVRETMGIAAYNAGEWQEAASELRAARRITGNTALLPLIADSERGLGRPERAIEIARSDDGRALTGEEATEMRIVESGARIDLGEPEKAVVTLQAADLKPGQSGTGPARLYYAYASALHAAGRSDDAMTWFMNAASADVDDVTDAELKLVELTEGFGDGDGDNQVDDIVERTAASDPAPGDTVAPSAAAESAVREPSSAPAPAPQRDVETVSPASSASGGATSAAVTPSDRATVSEKAVRSDPATVSDPAWSTDPATTDPTPTPPSSVSTDIELASRYDALLLDLDGTVFAGHKALPGARESLEKTTTARYFVTNNASRLPAEVVTHLVELGFDATAEQVVTSAQSAARLLAEHLTPGSRALVVGTDGLAQEVREVGIGVTRSADDRPAAVIQGHSPETGWAQLSEAALAINAGALWIACNTDATLPSERGKLVGNGSMVAAVANATGQQPLVAGKPAAPLMADAIARSNASRPLVVGDRLDTDIEGAHSVGVDSALVLTGVSSATDLLVAPPEQRPTFVIGDLTGLFHDVDAVRIAAQPDWHVTFDGDVATIDGDGRTESLVPALAAAVWQAVDDDQIDASLLRVVGANHEISRVLESVGVGSVR
ncbi:HAD-IIA family hydrolase [Gordonia sp. OPL2]|uniref:HAD-IIA family hydrolase n=1 Tax=Gordonia sp. OPL2 TaxID=2486274 RepID=UPI001654F202|nr:HAD-IIA family hydrolase [Gordonia sp. OPL2]RPA20020.1 HAD-IIA family hydrolase [Gordonia sp. OPL2]